MIELRILSGARRGESVVAPPPFSIGRHPGAGLSLSDPGVWERHAEIRRAEDGRLHLAAVGEGSLSIDSKPVREAVLRSGDRIALGSVAVEFRLATARQRDLELPERMVWDLLVGAAVLQALLVSRLAAS